ncbi:TMV resistance protein N-like isoform X1 [Pistacia vera]|uniref:TMV resistance protein N-like isoform X1 n=2 Tax=Pistacia vera TaxID=55513 RepID=UPI0012638E3A|nr:TMV resistance protein N-like isoform X1 [Pistacia vera]
MLEDIVGIDSRRENLMKLIRRTPDDVCMIGIFRMGGVGKTTIARVVYELLSYESEGHSFLANVREISKNSGLVSLQKQLLSQILMETHYNINDVYDGISVIRSRLQHKKVLVVIDDVDNVNQLNTLAGKHRWFGSGSRIIITTRDKHLLLTHGVDELYKVEELNDDDALKLFCLKAFKSCHPPKDYVEISKCIVKYAGGLPLALQVLGSLLFARTMDEWKGALERLNKDFEKEVLDVLQISFDGLKETEKKIFLDIACFFEGEHIDYVTKILDGCGFYPSFGIRVLVDKCLLTILDNNKLWMHDLLQEMGKQIVKRQSIEKPGKRSRLWEEGDIYYVLTKNTGSEVVEGIKLDPEGELHLSAKAFSKLINLRLLKVSNVQLPEGLKYLSNELRLLEWHGYPLKSLPSNLQMDRIVELKMRSSSIEQLWQGMKPLHQLKSINLSLSQKLNKTPDFTGVPNLEYLILEGCIKLREIHPSVVVHKKLILLNLKDCKSLTTLSSKINMASLRKLILSGCSKLKEFPQNVGHMECLSELFLDGTVIKELSSSVKRLTGLVLLNLKDCSQLESFSGDLNYLKTLRTLNLFGCSKLETLPENLGQVESLEELDVSGTAITQPESSICFMENLRALSFRGCKGTAPKPWCLCLSSKLMPRSYKHTRTLVLPSFLGLCSLTKLDLSDCNLGEGSIPNDFGKLFSLEELNLSKNNFVFLPSINRLPKLQCLKLEGSKRLQSLPELPPNINTIRLDACPSLETLSNGLEFRNSEFAVISCMNCLKLSDCCSMGLLMLNRYLKAMSNPRMEFSIVVPGNEVPKWVKQKSEDSSIRITRPSHEYPRKLVGYVVCSVFVVHKHQPALSDAFGTHKLFCHLKADEKPSSTSHFIYFEDKFGKAVSGHLWLLYLSRHEYLDLEWHNEYKHIEFLFSSQWVAGLEVKRCGVCPIYEQELKELC